MNTEEAYNRAMAGELIGVVVTNATDGEQSTHLISPEAWQRRLKEVPGNTNYVVVADDREVSTFKVGKTYLDAAGWRVTILAVNALNEGYPIVGECRLYRDTYALAYYALDGQCVSDGDSETLTLVEVSNT